MPHTPVNSKSGLVTCEHRPSATRILSHKSLARAINSSKMYDHSRLVGGADVPKEPELKPDTESANASPKIKVEVSSPPLHSPSVPAEDTVQPGVETKENRQPQPASGPCCVCISQTPGLVGDRKVDEIIEYVHQNLEEAVKALATLGENFEHDLKLMFVDILGRIKQWSGIVQNKLGSCKNEVNNLSKELLARACEVADLKAQIADYQDKRKRVRKTDKRHISDKLNAAPLKEEDKTYDDLEELDEEEEDQQEFPRKKIVERRRREEERERRETGEERERRETGEERERRETEEELERRETEEEPERRLTDRDERRPVRKRKKEDIPSTVSVQTVVQEKDRIKHESELEAEIIRLRKENERIMQERAEYENAIQRALLRGVSSLNVEALRVLRCPPIPCCAPCAPCPAATVVPPEPVVSCPMKTPKKRPETAAATICSNKDDRNPKNAGQTNSNTMRRPCGTCCSTARSRKFTDSSMFLLLR